MSASTIIHQAPPEGTTETSTEPTSTGSKTLGSNMIGTHELLICKACGTQFDTPLDKPLTNCRICDDPRQFVPPTGQQWTSLGQMQEGNYRNVFRQDPVEPRMWSVTTEPQFAIGQRAIFLQTDSGNVLWDCITWLDEETVHWINEKGGLKAIVISHPHFYTTHLDWAKAFGCKVYLAKPDEEWLSRPDKDDNRVLLTAMNTEIWPSGPRALIVGGHFPGSMILLWNKMILVADTMMAVPSALNPNGRTPGTTSYVFMYSYPNMLPLPPDTLLSMWNVLKTIDFESSHGGFAGRDVRDKNAKARVLESMQIQARNEGYRDHEIFTTKL